MKADKYSVKTLIFVFIISTSISIISSNKKDMIVNSKVIAEGVLSIIALGRTGEELNPSGFALKDPAWIIAPPTKNTTVFLRSNFSLKEYVDKKVHVVGRFLHVPPKKISRLNFMKPYDEMIVDTIYCIK